VSLQDFEKHPKHTQNHDFLQSLPVNLVNLISIYIAMPQLPDPQLPQSPDPSTYYQFPYFLHKKDYDTAFNNAREWAIKNPTESPRTAARIYHIKEEALRKSVARLRRRQLNSRGDYNSFGGNNKIMTPAMDEAIRQYCYEQWEAGFGASHEMVFAAISTLREV
jgi:hypothetical protein